MFEIYKRFNETPNPCGTGFGQRIQRISAGLTFNVDQNMTDIIYLIFTKPAQALTLMTN